MDGLMSPFRYAKKRIDWCTFRAKNCRKAGDIIAANAYENRIEQIKKEFEELTGVNYDSTTNVHD